MADHPTDNLDDQAPDGGIAKTPPGAMAAKRAFEDALRRGNQKDAPADTGSRQTTS